jgi:CBS domain containing-hemolysin-like protein
MQNERLALAGLRDPMNKALSGFFRNTALVAALLAAPGARAAFLSGEALDTAADVLAIIVLIIVPVAAIVVFWLVHILPEKIAEKRYHPQQESIKVLCLLSLVFGGMLWPIAWLWAYTRPVLFKAAYGVEKHESYFEEMGERARAGQLLREEIVHLREELDAMAAKGMLPPVLKNLRAELDGLHERATASAEGGR